MKILILGGDGYLGWPTSMYLASKNHDVAIVDMAKDFGKQNVLLNPYSLYLQSLQEFKNLRNLLGKKYKHLLVIYQTIIDSYTKYLKLLNLIQLFTMLSSHLPPFNEEQEACFETKGQCTWDLNIMFAMRKYLQMLILLSLVPWENMVPQY